MWWPNGLPRIQLNHHWLLIYQCLLHSIQTPSLEIFRSTPSKLLFDLLYMYSPCVKVSSNCLSSKAKAVVPVHQRDRRGMPLPLPLASYISQQKPSGFHTDLSSFEVIAKNPCLFFVWVYTKSMPLSNGSDCRWGGKPFHSEKCPAKTDRATHLPL